VLTIKIEHEPPRQEALEVLKGVARDLRNHLPKAFKGILVVDADAGVEYDLKPEPRSSSQPTRGTLDGDVLVYANYNVGSICALYATQTLGEGAILARALRPEQFDVKVRRWNGSGYEEVQV
jgi:hypothetical protein